MAVLCSLLLSSLAFAAWNLQNSGVSGTLYAVHFPEGIQVGYVVGADMDSLGGEVGLVLKTTDGGDTWAPHLPGTSGSLSSVYFKDNDTGFAVGAAGVAIRTYDGGATWDTFSVPTSEALTGIQFPGNGQVGYIFTRPRNPPSKVLKTTDGGSNWTAISVGGPASVTRGGGFANDSVGVIVGDDGLVIHTANGLDSFWFGGAMTNADLTAATFAPDDPDKGYLVGHDSARGVIRYTDDFGATPWDSVRCWSVSAYRGLDMPATEIAFFVGDSAGEPMIVRTVAPTEAWRTVLPGGLTAALYGVHFPNGADTGYAVGAGGVILRTDDRGGLPPHWVAEEKGPDMARAGIRVVSNPSRRGIAFDSGIEADVLVYDALGRVVARQKAAKGPNSLPLHSGVYVLRVRGNGLDFTGKLVVER